MSKRHQQVKGISTQKNGIAGCGLNNRIDRLVFSEIQPVFTVPTGNPNSYMLGTRGQAARAPLTEVSRDTANSEVRQ